MPIRNHLGVECRVFENSLIDPTIAEAQSSSRCSDLDFGAR